MQEKLNNFINNNIFAQVFGIFGFFLFLYCIIVAAVCFVAGDFLSAALNIIFSFAVIPLPFFIISLLVASFLNIVFFAAPNVAPKKFFNNKIVAVVINIGLGYTVFSLLVLLVLTVIL